MHASFKLHGKSFKNSTDLLSFSKTISKEVYHFLFHWFDNHPCITVNTSGSTGKPKPILLKKEFMKNSAKATGAFFNLKPNTKALCCLSTEYIAGKMMLVRALELGWDLDIINPIGNPLENTFTNYDFCAMVPLQVKQSIKNLKKVKKMIIGGGVVSQELQNQLQNIPTKCYATYGMTETITHIAIKKLNHIDIHKESQNNYTLLTDINITKDNRDCLIIDAPQLSDEKIITNDIVTIHNENEFEWLGRYDNVINSGGLKLHPEQIEKELSKNISERFFVIGIPDEVLGEKLVLIVEGKQQELNLQTIKLSKYKKPKHIYFVDKFIETETKKIQRKKTLDLVKFSPKA